MHVHLISVTHRTPVSMWSQVVGGYLTNNHCKKNIFSQHINTLHFLPSTWLLKSPEHPWSEDSNTVMGPTGGDVYKTASDWEHPKSIHWLMITTTHWCLWNRTPLEQGLDWMCTELIVKWGQPFNQDSVYYELSIIQVYTTDTDIVVEPLETSACHIVCDLNRTTALQWLE